MDFDRLKRTLILIDIHRRRMDVLYHKKRTYKPATGKSPLSK
jgi:hypothetical protein